MPILLVKTSTSAVPESPGRWLAGEIVAVVEDGHEFGFQEVAAAGNFYHVTVTDKTLEQVEGYLQEFKHEPEITVLNNQAPNFRLQIESTMVSASGKNALTRELIEPFLESWTGVYVAHTNTTLSFDVDIIEVAKSEGFWGEAASSVVWGVCTYSGGNVSLSITSSTFTPEQIENKAEILGGTVETDGSITVPASSLRDELEDDIKELTSQISFARRRWVINTNGMNFLAANNGAVSGTAAQISGYLLDVLTT